MILEVSTEKEALNKKINAAHEKISGMEHELRLVDIKLEDMLAERQKYSLLSELADRLDRLNKIDATELFWGKNFDEETTLKHIHRLNNLVVNYDTQYKETQARRIKIQQDIQTVISQSHIYAEEIQILMERAEESKNEFIVEREMTHFPYRPMVLPWTVQGEDEKRFRKILLLTLLLSILFGLLLPMWDLPINKREVVEIPERLAKLLIKKEAPPPPPPKVEKKLEEEQKKDKQPPKDVAKPDVEKVKLARKKASQSGLLAFKDDFAQLMDNEAEKKLGAQARISSAGAKASQISRSLVTSQVAGASGGINTSALSRDTGSAGGSLEGVEFSRIESAIGSDFFGEERPLSDGPGPSRTDEEIQIVFDRYKAALYRIYNRELRRNPMLQGKVVLRMTIEPNGSVSACKVESSDMNAPELDAKIVERVLKFNFGEKEGVPTITILYPIDFLPSS